MGPYASFWPRAPPGSIVLWYHMSWMENIQKMHCEQLGQISSQFLSQQDQGKRTSKIGGFMLDGHTGWQADGHSTVACVAADEQ